jgi:FlaA1/EpsC-like NDP-sugar epimerase
MAARNEIMFDEDGGIVDPPPPPINGYANIVEPLPEPPEPVQSFTGLTAPRVRSAGGKHSAEARINPDSRGTLWLALILVLALMISSFVVSFSGIWDISQYTGLPTIIQWVPAVFIDAAILAYTISLFVFKARGESTWRTLAWLLAFAGVSVAANVSHTLDYLQQTGVTDWRIWIGVAITASAPVAVLAASEEISRLAFKKIEAE